MKILLNAIKNFLYGIKLSTRDVSVTYENGFSSMWFNPHCGIYSDLVCALKSLPLYGDEVLLSEK